MTKQVFWIGPGPTECEICYKVITDVFIDGRTLMRGSWAWQCVHCFYEGVGIGKLGPGFGQKYVKQEDGRWLKVEG